MKLQDKLDSLPKTIPLDAACFKATSVTEFLRARYDQLKRDHDFSHRQFARLGGFGSPNYLKMVADGLRPLTVDAFPQFCRGLLLSPEGVKVLGVLLREKQLDVVDAVVGYTSATTVTEAA